MTTEGHFDVAVIGGGIVGLAHAWRAAERGLRVLLLERSPVAQGASIRNFGMIWPIGQPVGELYDLALQSRDLWLTLNAAGVVSAQECGSIHLAHHEDELAVLEEFCGRQSHQARMIRRDDVLKQTQFANPDGLLGGMLSPTELRVDPRTAASRISKWLSETQGVTCCFDTTVIQIDGQIIRSADGRIWNSERTVVCSGADLQTLYASVLQHSQLQLCKLQMLRTSPQPQAGQCCRHIASGLTLRHYASFRDCRALSSLRERIRAESPELDEFGIHVMASPRPGGDVILGDSHQYGANITPFDRAEIDQLILRELRKVIRLADWTIQERWHGIYAKHPELPVFETTTTDGVRIFTGTGGLGMTLAFGLAERAWKRWEGEHP